MSFWMLIAATFCLLFLFNGRVLGLEARALSISDLPACGVCPRPSCLLFSNAHLAVGTVPVANSPSGWL